MSSARETPLNKSLSQPNLIGIAGGTGAGKTTVANTLVKRLGTERTIILPQDAYYRDRSNLTPKEREEVNYDHPDAIENDLLMEHLKMLKAGKLIERPIYDYVTHTRSTKTVKIVPCPVIILDGIMILVHEGIRQLLDFKIFMETDPDVRLIRRFQRDILERGRSFESVARQYFETVRPMHQAFVEPSKRYADIIIPEGYNEVTIDLIVSRFHSAFDHVTNS